MPPTVTPQELRARVATRIRELAKAKDLPLSRLADTAGVSRSTFWAVLRGEFAPTTDTLALLAGVLGVEPAVLLRAPRSGT